jgi:hypothetical protein
MTQRVVYNACYGGYSVHRDAVAWMREQGDEDAEDATLPGEYYDDGSGPKSDWEPVYSIPRDNELLAKMVLRETGYDGPVGGRHADLSVAEVPDNVEWTIDEYDGQETVREKARTFSGSEVVEE